MAAFFKVLLKLVFIAICIAAGAGLASCSFDQLRQVRQIERVPQSPVDELLVGEAKSSGVAASAGELLTGPYTNTPCVYYEDLVEREETDSDGDTEWVTVSHDKVGVDFLLKDETGTVLLTDPELTDIKAEQKWRKTEGDMRYTEYRIDPGEQLFVSGYILRRGAEPVFDFRQAGDYVPMVSYKPEMSERRGFALGSIIACGFAVVFWSIAVVLLCGLVRIHLSIVFFTIQGCAIAASLLGFGLHASRIEILAAKERIERLGEMRLDLIRNVTGQQEATWQSLPGLEGLSGPQAKQGRAAMLGYAQAVSRYNKMLAYPPELVVAMVTSIKSAPVPKLPAALRQEFANREAAFEPTRIGPLGAWLMMGGGLLLTFIFSKIGFGTVIKKRLIENIPTTKTAGVVYGLNELVGQATVDAPLSPLRGPLSQAACVYYHYLIKEKRGSGKNSKWVTIHNEKQDVPFACRDSEGEIMVYPEGAEFLSNNSSRRREGRRVYKESRIEVSEPIYLIGTAQLDEEAGDHLVIRRDEEKKHLLISNMGEVGVLLHKARVAFAWMTAAMNCMAFAALALWAYVGGLNALTYSLAAIGPAIYALMILAILMFNDLVFLRQRTRSTWSNIEVALKKRYDLFGQLERVVAGMFEHEREVQTKVAALRESNRSSPGLIALQEAYPSLQSNDVAMQVADQLTRVENEIALMREGYNNAVERYNTRRTHFPEILFTQSFGFREAPFWSGDASPDDQDGTFRTEVRVA